MKSDLRGITITYPGETRNGEDRYKVEPPCPRCDASYVKLVQFRGGTVAYICPVREHRRLSFRKGVVRLSD